MILALGTPLPANVKPWKLFDVDAIMVSAYYIMKSKATRRRVMSKGLKDYLEFDGPVVLDSGVFQLINSGKDVDYKEIRDIYRTIEGVDIKLGFDFPDDRILEQYLKFRRYEIEPVIPASQHNLLPFFEDEECEWIFVGRLAKELIQKGCRGFNFVEKTTKLFSKNTSKKLWALGVGNYNTVPFIEKANFSASDTSSYRVAAAFGDILVPGKGTRHISGRKKDKKNWYMKLAKKEDLMDYLDSLDFTFKEVKNDFTKRAIFNAYTLTQLNRNCKK